MQHSIQYIGCKIWNDLLEKVKKKFHLADTLFGFHIKIFLIEV